MAESIYPCLWFDGKAKEAAEFYGTIFQDSRIISENSTVVIFELNGNRFMGLNGGPQFTFTEAISMVVSCETQEEIYHYWEKLTDGGEEGRCGWLKDKYGLSWQIIPTTLAELFQNAERAPRVGEALQKMKKLDIETLKNA